MLIIELVRLEELRARLAQARDNAAMRDTEMGEALTDAVDAISDYTLKHRVAHAAKLAAYQGSLPSLDPESFPERFALAQGMELVS